MTIYYYNKSHPNLDTLSTLVRASDLSAIYDYSRWDEDDGKLKIIMIRQLVSAEIVSLDNMVATV